MKYSRWFWLIGVFLCACGATAPPLPTPVTHATLPDTHMVVAVQGDVRIHRADWNKHDAFTTALVGMVVQHGDLLDFNGAGQVTIVCADLKLETIDKDGGIACAKPESALSSNGSRITPTRDPQNPPPLLLLAPRKTMLLDPRPTLRWQPADGVTTYQVAVTRGGETIWSSEVNGKTTITYPADAPPLEPGRFYEVVITAGELSSRAEGEEDLAFTLLAPEQAAAVREAEQRIRDLALDELATGLLIANLCARHSLYAEAIEQLEGLPEAVRTQSPVVARLLGDWYVATGLNALAVGSYQQALACSERLGDREGQALAHTALARIYAVPLQCTQQPDDQCKQEAAERRTEARQQFADARALYDELGSTIMIEQIKSEIESVESE